MSVNRWYDEEEGAQGAQAAPPPPAVVSNLPPLDNHYQWEKAKLDAAQATNALLSSINDNITGLRLNLVVIFAAAVLIWVARAL